MNSINNYYIIPLHFTLYESFSHIYWLLRLSLISWKLLWAHKGLDKILISPDGEITITNDGWPFWKKSTSNIKLPNFLVELSKSQDDEIGDGTTGVVVLAGALLEQAEALLDRGIHPIKIADGYQKACDIAVAHLDRIADRIEFSKETRKLYWKLRELLLAPKLWAKCHEQFAQMAVDAIFCCRFR